MKRTELELAIVTATHIIAQPRILVIGSQAILGSFDETELPARATASQEIDMAPLQEDMAESLATRIDVLVEAGLVSPERVSQRLREISDPRFSPQAKNVSLQFVSSLG